MQRIFKMLSLAACLCVFVGSAHAQTPQQVDQFSKLSPQQQRQLAQQLGIDEAALQQRLNAQPTSTAVEPTPEYPRGTQFDEMGQPVGGVSAGQFNAESLEKKPLTLFGLDLFANAPSTFSPQLTGDVPSEYVIGPGDEISLQIFGKDNAVYALTVDINGNITIPELGPVSLLGKTYAEAQALVRNKIEQSLLGVQVSMSLSKLKTIRVFISGEAYKPGSYNLNALSSITNGLYAAGGVTDIASLRSIQLNRQGERVVELDLYDLLINGDATNDVSLRHGDIIHIPTIQNVVTVDGEVRRPALYELKNEVELAQVLALAGNVKPMGFTSRVGVKRVIDGVLRQLTVNTLEQSFNVTGGDHIHVPTISSRVQGGIALIGAVVRPGRYQWYEGITVTELLGNLEASLLDNADPNYILVVRQPTISSELSFHQKSLRDSRALELKPNDLILVFSKRESNGFNQEKMDDFAATSEQISMNRDEFLSTFIEERVRLQQLGVYNVQDDVVTDEGVEASTVRLTELEKSEIRNQLDAYPFSRRNLLNLVLKRINQDASFNSPPKLIEVSGAVRVPGIYPLTEGATIKDAIAAAGGLLSEAFSERSEITRVELGERGQETSVHLEFSPMQQMQDNDSKIVLQPRDRLNIFTIPEWKEELRITLKGEVVFPGEYTVKRGETYGDLLARAGGYTRFADADAIVYTRERLKIQERRNLRRLADELRKDIASENLRRDNSPGAIVPYDEARKLLQDLTQTEAVGRLVLNTGVGDGAAEVVLENQDVIHIPKISQSINVIGEVYVPTSHLYDENITFEIYIERSGGYRPLADEERIYIIRADGSVVLPNKNSGYWFSDESNTVYMMPGDTIVVPYDSTRVDSVTLWTNATQILYQIAVAIAAIGSL